MTFIASSPTGKIKTIPNVFCHFFLSVANVCFNLAKRENIHEFKGLQFEQVEDFRKKKSNGAEETVGLFQIF